jgi:ribosomal protein L11
MNIVKTKFKDLNARDDEAAFCIITGTAKWALRSSIKID